MAGRCYSIRGLFLGLLLLTAMPRAERLTGLEAFRQSLLVEERAVQAQQEQRRQDIQKLTTLRANLKLPEQAGEDQRARQNLDQATQALKATELRLRELHAYLTHPCLALPTHMEGHVSRCVSEARCEPADDHRPLLEGERLQTGPDGSLLLVIEDGSRIVISPDSVLQLKMRSPSEVLYRLEKGRLHLVSDPIPVHGLVGQIGIETPTARLTLQPGPNEIDVRLDGNNQTYLVLPSGGLDVVGDPSGVKWDSHTDWWRRAIPASYRRELTGSDWFRIASLEGVAAIWRADGEPRRAAVGHELAPSEALATGPHGLAWGFMEGGVTASVAPDSVLRYRRSRRNKAAWTLDKGECHLEADALSPEVAIADLETGDSVAQFPKDSGLFASRALSISVKTYTKGPSEWMPLRGAARITRRPASR